MSGIDFLADTNVLLYILEDLPQVGEISKSYFAVSVISEIELLGKKDITTQEVKIIKSLLSDCVSLPFTDQIKEKTIELKQKYGIKVPDAIIASTSIAYNIPLVTADRGFKKITGLDVHILEL
ncbi:MAG: type II toxin-antitoxin system VapC family toxin [Flavobacteriaceae bacterium]